MGKIDNTERISTLKEEEYKSILGVEQKTFVKMLEILEAAYRKLHKKGGKRPTLTVLDKLVITLGYWREYRTYRNIAFDYGVTKTAIGDSVLWVEHTIIADGTFSLPSKRALQRGDDIVCVGIVDVTEQEIERPKKNKRSGIRVKRNATP